MMAAGKNKGAVNDILAVLKAYKDDPGYEGALKAFAKATEAAQLAKDDAALTIESARIEQKSLNGIRTAHTAKIAEDTAALEELRNTTAYETKVMNTAKRNFDADKRQFEADMFAKEVCIGEKEVALNEREGWANKDRAALNLKRGALDARERDLVAEKQAIDKRKRKFDELSKALA